MRVTVNGNELEVHSGTSVVELLSAAHVPPNYLAVEINDDVVPRDQHSTRIIQEGDRVEVVTLVGGG